jgi:hypothetical protein
MAGGREAAHVGADLGQHHLVRCVQRKEHWSPDGTRIA